MQFSYWQWWCIILLHTKWTSAVLVISKQGEGGECGTPGIKGDRVRWYHWHYSYWIACLQFENTVFDVIYDWFMWSFSFLQGLEGALGPRGVRGPQVSPNSRVYRARVFVRQDFILFKQSHRREKKEHFLLSIQSNVQTDRLAVF